ELKLRVGGKRGGWLANQCRAKGFEGVLRGSAIQILCREALTPLGDTIQKPWFGTIMGYQSLNKFAVTIEEGGSLALNSQPQIPLYLLNQSLRHVVINS